MDVAQLVSGLALLLVGGFVMVRGATGLAVALGVSEATIGLTVVAFGTSAPELAVNGLAAVRGSGGIAFGNVIGSNLANLGLILGITALVTPLSIEGRIVSREIPLMLLATGAVFVLGVAHDFSLSGDVYTRTDGVMLLMLFAVFMYGAVGDVLRQRRADPVLVQVGEVVGSASVPSGFLRNAVLTLVGLGLLVLGGELTVSGATGLARTLGYSETVIGLTVVAIGTSLPELVTSLVAAVRRQADMAVANVVGSNIFNLLFVFGVTSTLAPIRVPAGGLVDLGVLLALTALLLPFAVSHGRRFMRWEGALLLMAWIVYTVYKLTIDG